MNLASSDSGKIEPVTLYVSEGIGAYMFEFRQKPFKYFTGKGPLDQPR
jgi:hypothetical protein